MRRAEIVPATRELAGRLGIARGDEAVLLDRVRLANHCPIAIGVCYLPHARFPGILERNDFSQESLYDILRRDHGLLMVWADQTIRTGLPDAAEL